MMIFMNSWWSGLKCYDAKGGMSYNVSSESKSQPQGWIWAECRRHEARYALLSVVLTAYPIYVTSCIYTKHKSTIGNK